MRFEYGSPAAVAAIMERARQANFNVIYFQVRGAADALYRSGVEPCAVSLVEGAGLPSVLAAGPVAGAATGPTMPWK